MRRVFEAFDRKTIRNEVDMVIDHIKSNGYYDFYKNLVLTNEEGTSNFLKRVTMIGVKNNAEAQTMITTAAFDLMFGLIDQKLRNEILTKGE